MADQEQVTRLGRSVGGWNKWRSENPKLLINLLAVNLAGAILRGANLRGANLEGANLEGVNLEGVNLGGANLRGVNLDGATLDGAILDGAILERAALRQATLVRVELARANLRESNLVGANLFGCNLYAADLTKANLLGADLSAADLSLVIGLNANFSRANLQRARLAWSDLRKANLYRADLSNTVLKGAKLEQAVLCDANLQSSSCGGASFRAADLSGADLSFANLQEADLAKSVLEGANLFQARVQGATFRSSILSGACLEGWSINQETQFSNVDCDFVFLQRDHQERRPHNGIFKPGELVTLLDQALSTVDLIFTDGIDWKAFFSSFQELKNAHDDEISVQGIERKAGNAFVVRLEVAEDADKATIEREAKALYDNQLQLLEVEYRKNLQLQGAELTGYKRENANLMQILAWQAQRPINMSQTTNPTMSQLQGPQFNNDFDGANIGNFANQVSDNASMNATQNIYASDPKTPAEAAQEIHDLLVQLAQDNPLATNDDRAEHLRNTLPPNRLQRSIELLQTAGEAAVESLPGGKVITAVLKKVREQEATQRQAQDEN